MSQLGGTVYSSGGSSSSIWSPAVTENGGGFPGDHQRLAWTSTASQQQCYQNYSSYYTNMDYLSPTPHQLNVVVNGTLNIITYSIFHRFIIILIFQICMLSLHERFIEKLLQDGSGSGLDNTWSKTRDESASSWFYNSAGWGERKWSKFIGLSINSYAVRCYSVTYHRCAVDQANFEKPQRAAGQHIIDNTIAIIFIRNLIYLT